MQTLERRQINLSGVAKKQLPDPFASVRLEPMSVAGQEVPRLAVVAKDEQGKDVYLADIGQPDHLETIWDGKRFIDRFMVEAVHIETNGTGDHLRLGIQALNSYDGSIAFGVEFFALRIKCLNQFHFGNLLGSFVFKHVQATTDEMMADAIEQLRLGAHRFLELAPYIRQLQQKQIGLDQLIKWHLRLYDHSPAWPDSYTGKVITALHEEDLTVWGLLNAYTRVTTHAIGGLSGGRLSRVVCDYALEFVKS